MTEKKSPNPFINMANEAKTRSLKVAPEKAQQIQKAKAPKPSTTVKPSTTAKPSRPKTSKS